MSTRIEASARGSELPATVFDVIVSLPSRVFGALGLVVAFLMPPRGFGPGWDLCLLHRVTGVPCPGCGLTRSVASVAHLEFGRAVAMHPFGFFFFALFLLLTLYAALPRAGRDRLRAWSNRHERALNRFYVAAAVLFLGFGILRGLWVAARLYGG